MAQLSPLERFHRAWFAPDLTLHGYTCPPFCLGHLVTLSAIGSPFARLGQEFSYSAKDVFLFLQICSAVKWPFRGWDDATAPDPELVAKVGADEDELRRTGDTIEVWQAECASAPELWENEESTPGRGLTAPTVLTFAAKLLANGFSEQRVFSMPMGLVRWWALTFAEMDGADVRFLTDHDVEAMDELQKEQEAVNGQG